MQIKTIGQHDTPIRTVKIWDTSTTSEDGEDSHSSLVGTQNNTATSEDSLGVSYRMKYTLTIWSSNGTPWDLPKEVKTYVHSKPAHRYHSGFIHHWHNLEAILQRVSHPDNGILFNDKKKWATCGSNAIKPY